jgi:hypothetical protein
MQNYDVDNVILVQADRWGTLGKALRALPGRGGISRWLGEKAVSTYKDKMNVLREVDDKIYDWTTDLDDILKKIKKAFKSRRIIDVAILFAQIDKRLRQVEEEGKNIENLYESELEDFEDKYEEDLDLLKEWYEQYGGGKTSTAGWLEDLGRKYVSRRMERATTKERNIAIQNLIGMTSSVIANVQTLVDELGDHRNAGKIGEYLSTLKKIEVEQQKFQSGTGTKPGFKDVYEAYLKGPVEEVLEKNQTQIDALRKKKEEEAAEKAEESSTTQPMPEVEGVPPTVDDPDVPPVQEEPPPAPEPQTTETIPEEPAQPKESPIPLTRQKQEEAPIPLTRQKQEPQEPQETLVSEEAEEGGGEEEEESGGTVQHFVGPGGVDLEGIRRGSHAEFIDKLTKCAEKNDPQELVKMLLSYANELDDAGNVEDSLKLMTIAEGVIYGDK